MFSESDSILKEKDNNQKFNLKVVALRRISIILLFVAILKLILVLLLWRNVANPN